MNLVANLPHRLYQPVDIAFLVYFRIIAGTLMAFEFAVYFYSRIGEFTQTGVNFTYLFFDWMPHWSATGFYLHVTSIVVLSLLVAVGFYYRVTIVLLFLAQLALFLMEKSIYQNHIYLFWLVCLLMIFLPAHRAFSWDVRRRPSIQTTQVPAWTWYLLLFQISVVYFYAGVAKLYSDWWEARPMIIWLFHKSNYPVIGGLLGSEWFPYFVSYAGIIFDLTVVPLLLFRRTRVFGFIIALLFHLSNAAIFGLVSFPWFSIMMTSLFFGPAWPRRIIGRWLPRYTTYLESYRPSRWAAPLLSLYVVVQLLLPLRHWLYPLDTAWTDQGHYFAWRMMLRTKFGDINYRVVDKHGNLVATDAAHRLTYRQRHDLTGDPDMMLQYAHYLASCYEDSLQQPVRVYLDTQISLNGWEFQPMVDPTVDLAQEKRTLGHYSWLLPWKPISPLAANP